MLKRRVVKALLPLGLGFIILVLSAVVTIWLSSRQQEAVVWVRHTLLAETRISFLQSLITDAESAQRGYLLTGRSAYLEPYRYAMANIPIELQLLRKETADNPRQQQFLDSLEPVLRQKLRFINEIVKLAQGGSTAAAISMVRTEQGLNRMREIRSILKQMIFEENRLLVSRSTDLGLLNSVSRFALLISALFVSGFAWFVVRDANGRLAQIDQGQKRLTEEMHERQSAQSQVVQLQKMEAVGQLTGGIAHDFNNMLSVVIGSLDIASRRLASADPLTAKKYIDGAMEGAELAASLTASLLAFSRLQPLEPKVVNLNVLVSGMGEMLSRALGESVQVEIGPDNGLWSVFTDVAQIEIAIINLAINGRDAMLNDGKLTLETSNCQLDERYASNHDEVKSGDYVMLSITDTGMGMSQETIDRAFDPFFTTKPVGQGTGLGLSQVFGFLKQSNGHVKIYSELGSGTTIKLYLPRHVGGDEVENALSYNLEVSPRKNEITVLVVEDRDQVRRMTSEALQELGYHVVDAADGYEALSILEAQLQIDLLLTDIIMPGMTGRELANRAMVDRPGLKVRYTSGYTRNAIVHNGIVDQSVSFLAKPFTVTALALKVNEVLKN